MAVCAITGFPGLVVAWEPGTYPAAPLRMHSAGFAVDNQDRNDVIAFWHAVYQASEGYEDRINWNGNYSGTNGTVAPAFVKDVERRLNYFRAMAGVDSNAVVNANSTVVIDPLDAIKPAPSTQKSSAAQNAALMLARNYDSKTGQNPALTHYPAENLTGWSPAAWNATSKGNFAFGLYGPGAITEYMVEQYSKSAATSSWNSLVGHRRWNLYPRATVYATGDQPGTSAYNPPSNVFYVLQKPAEYLEESGVGFVAYPPAGFFPANINSPYWSLSREDADFSVATVKITDSAGRDVPVTGIQRSTTYGDPAMVWAVGATAGSRTVAGDTTFYVRVSGILGLDIPGSYSYSVTLINPDLLTSDQQLAGPASVASKLSGAYTFTPPPRAEALQVVAFRKNTTTWKENAESASKARVIDGTGANYPLLAKASTFGGFGGVSGKSSFRLTFPTIYDLMKRGVPDQTFEINRDIIANAKAKVSFQYRRGFMTRSSFLAVEMSSNGGATWKALGAPIKGVSDTNFDGNVTTTTRPLPKSATPLRIRFRYYTNGGPIYTHDAAPASPTGIFIDDIKTSGCNWLEPKKATNLSASTRQFTFTSGSAGAKLAKGDQWQLRLRTKLGGKWFPYGPAKAVKISN